MYSPLTSVTLNHNMVLIVDLLYIVDSILNIVHPTHTSVPQVIGGTILFLNLVILWTARKKHCRTPINGLVYGLCVEDLLTALIIIPLFIASFKSDQ